MQETTQLNLRISKQLIKDMKFISRYYNLDRNDWFKVELGKMITREKSTVIQELNNLYLGGHLSKAEYKTQVGKMPSEELESLKISSKEAARRYFNDVRQKTK